MTSEISLYDKFKETGKQGLIYGIGSVTQRLSAILLIPLYTTVLLSEEYGTLGLIIISGQIALTVFSLGLRSSLFRSFYDYDDDQNRKIVISTIFFITVISGVILFICGILFSNNISQALFNTGDYKFYFIIITLITILSLVNHFAFSVFRANQQAKKYVLLQTSLFVLKIGLIIVFVALLGWGILGVLYGHLTATAVFFVLLLWQIRKYFVFKFSLPEAGKMLRYGIPFVFVGLFGFVLTYIDRYILNYFSNLHAVGIYTLGYQLGMVMSVVLITPVKLVWGPVFLSIKNNSNFNIFCSKALTYLVYIGGIFFLGIALLSRELLYLISAPEYWSAYSVIPIISLTYLIWSARSIIEVGVILKRKTTAIAFYSFVGALINLILNIVLIPRYGIKGAAFATLISFIVTITIDYLYNSALYKISYEWIRLLKITLVISIIFSTGFFFIVDHLIVSIIFKVAMILLYPFVLLLLKFYTKEEIKRIKQILPKFSNS